MLGETKGFTAISRNKVLIILTPENLSMKGLGDTMYASRRFSVAKFASKIE